MRASARKITSREPRRSRRTGICRFAARSATARSKTEKTFHRASEQFLREYDFITRGERSQVYVNGQHRRSHVHLVPFFGPLGLSEITAGKVQEYRIHRLEEATAKRGKPPVRSTMHQEILRQTLKAAIRNGWLDRMPDLSEPYRSSPKISHRAWFSPEEYKKLYEATGKRAQEPKATRYRWESEQFYDYVLFAANTGLRPDEAWRLQFQASQSLKTTRLVKPSSKLKCAANAASATARACPAPSAPLRD
jgi:integrase